MLRSHIEQIPIPAAPPDKMQQIINLTEQISNCENAAEFAKYDRQIDELVWNLKHGKKHILLNSSTTLEEYAF